MEGSIQTEQALLEEIRALRARVAQLEQAEKEQKHLPALVSKILPASEEVRTLEAIFETITDGLIVYDSCGKITRMNRVARELLGTDSRPDFSALSLEQRSDLLKLRDDQGHLLPVQRILRGEALAGDESADITLTALDGRKRQLNINGAPLRDRNGKIVGAVLLCHDVTERRKLERQTHDALKALLAMAEVLVQGTDRATTGDLAQSTSPINRVVQRLLKLARHMLGCRRIGVVLLESGTEVLHPLAVVGSSLEEMQRWQSYLEGSHLSDHVTDPEKLAALYGGDSVRFVPKSPGGETWRHCSLVVPMRLGAQLIGLLSLDYGADARSPHDPHRGEIALAEAVSRLTALLIERERLLQERAEAQGNELALLEANRRMDEFLSIASHELRTPLTTINGNLQLARRRLKTLLPVEAMSQEIFDKMELVVDLLRRAEHQVRLQNRLVGDLLDVSRIQANRLDLHIEICDLLAIVRETVEDIRASMPTRAIHLHTPDVPALSIEADCDRIGQVVANYLTNALKYSPPDSPVEVTVSVEGERARVAVSDEGPGLPAEEQQRLWQRFYRVPGINVQSGTETGLGLGLHICSSIIERHHGQVGVVSAPDAGATFWFTLPRAESAE